MKLLNEFALCVLKRVIQNWSYFRCLFHCVCEVPIINFSLFFSHISSIILYLVVVNLKCRGQCFVQWYNFANGNLKSSGLSLKMNFWIKLKSRIAQILSLKNSTALVVILSCHPLASKKSLSSFSGFRVFTSFRGI